MVERCESCYRRIDSRHRAFGACPDEMVVKSKPEKRERVSQRGYVPPSRANRQHRDEYLESVRTTREQKLELQRERQRKYREKKATGQ